MGYYFVTKHFDTKVTTSASASVEFEQAKAQFTGQKPLIELDERGQFLRANPDRPDDRARDDRISCTSSPSIPTTSASSR